MSGYKVVLASASPRRKDILQTIGLNPVIETADIDETPFPEEDPKVYVKRLAIEKAETVAVEHHDSLVIAGDTIVVLDNKILQKPSDEEEAKEMLKRLSGNTHYVLTGMAILDTKHNKEYSIVSETEVLMRDYDDHTIDQYIKTGEPMDKAGAYGIQGIGSILVDELHGDYNVVVGLSVRDFIRGLEALGLDFFEIE